MREVKFRAWDNIKKEWTLNIMECVSSYTGNIWMEPALKSHKVVIEQSTGLKDKNGKEIFEGDIVRIMGYGTYEVFWRSWDSSFSLRAIDTDIEEHKILMLCEDWEGDYTIIGNIHEYPELLEPKPLGK